MSSVLRELRRAWDARARSDPLYWSCVREPWRASRDLERCLEEGRSDALALLAPALARLGFDARGRRLLDLGSGFGRMFRGYAQAGFACLVGAEISLEMARLGAAWQAAPGARFVLVDGDTLSCFRDAGFDCVVSRGVLAHQHEERRVWRLVAELERVLAPGGVFLLHFGGHRLGPLRRALRRLPFAAPAEPQRERRLAETTPAPAPERTLARLERLGLRELELTADPRSSSRSHPRYYVSGRKPPR